MAGEMKDSNVAKVKVGFDGRVHKWYRGPLAKERFENEHRILKYLEGQGCQFVPRVLEADPEELYLVTSNVGHKVGEINQDKLDHLFRELENYGVEHDDQANRNVTYNPRLGRFCIIDFEFARILSTGEGLSHAEAEEEGRRWGFASTPFPPQDDSSAVEAD